MEGKTPSKELVVAGTAALATAADAFFSFPIGTALHQIVTFSSSLKEELFNEKIRLFLSEMSEITDAQKIDFLQAIDDDPVVFKKKLIVQIDRLDDEAKAKMLAKLFKATVIKFIDIPTFRRLSSIIERAYVDDLALLPLVYDQKIPGYKVKQPDRHANLRSLSSLGLLTERPSNNKLIAGLIEYTPNEIGLMLLKYGYE
jgi:hypothetical protein